ncbi:MAG: hypothetical protein JXR81_02625 [Candidatus Goldbacteria bacterium]|nr:hypothetical protein [Candidatus Goldiibacteriota bacterium]
MNLADELNEQFGIIQDEQPEIIKTLLSVGINLTEHGWGGFHEWAVSKEQALEIINKCSELGIAVLGGDVIEIINGKPVHITEEGENKYGWWFGEEWEKDYVVFARKSADYSKKYISSYKRSSKNIEYFNLILMTEEELKKDKERRLKEKEIIESQNAVKLLDGREKGKQLSGGILDIVKKILHAFQISWIGALFIGAVFAMTIGEKFYPLAIFDPFVLTVALPFILLSAIAITPFTYLAYHPSKHKHGLVLLFLLTVYTVVTNLIGFNYAIFADKFIAGALGLIIIIVMNMIDGMKTLSGSQNELVIKNRKFINKLFICSIVVLLLDVLVIVSIILIQSAGYCS